MRCLATRSGEVSLRLEAFKEVADAVRSAFPEHDDKMSGREYADMANLMSISGFTYRASWDLIDGLRAYGKAAGPAAAQEALKIAYTAFFGKDMYAAEVSVETLAAA